MENGLANLNKNERVLEGRKRFLNVLDQIGAAIEPVVLLDFQQGYYQLYNDFLNKQEVRKFFGKGHLKTVFEIYMQQDVELSTDIQQTGSLFIKMKRSLEEALKDNERNSRTVLIQEKEEPKSRKLIPLSQLPPSKNKFEIENENIVPKFKKLVKEDMLIPGLDTGLPLYKPTSNPKQEVSLSGGRNAPKTNDLLLGDDDLDFFDNKKPMEPKTMLKEKEQDYEWGDPNKGWASTLKKPQQSDTLRYESDSTSDSDDDEGLDAGNELLRARQKLEAKKEQLKKVPESKAPPQKMTHGQKYLMEVMKRREKQAEEDAAAAAENNVPIVSPDGAGLDDENVVDEMVASRLEKKRLVKAQKELKKASFEEDLILLKKSKDKEQKEQKTSQRSMKATLDFFAEDSGDSNASDEPNTGSNTTGGGSEDTYKEEDEILLSHPTNNKQPEERRIESDETEEMHDDVDEAFYSRIKNIAPKSELATASSATDKTKKEDEEVYLMNALVMQVVMVRGSLALLECAEILVTLYGSRLYKKHFRTEEDLLKFIKKYSSNISYHQGPKDVTLLWGTSGDNEYRTLVRKLGKHGSIGSKTTRQQQE